MATCNNITSNTVPNPSLMLQVTAVRGLGALMQNLGKFVGYYQALNSTIDVDIVLPVNGVYTGAAASQLVLKTSTPVTLLVNVSAGVSFTVTVNSLFVLDSAFIGFTVTNGALAGAAINLVTAS